MNATIFNIQRFSIHDGPGIRTTLFFSGCALRCAWCHNPEGLFPGAGRAISADELLQACLADRTFMTTSGGGITLSGGEPVLQSGFLQEFLPMLQSAGLGTLLQTSGAVRAASLLALVPLVDSIWFDWKASTPEGYKRWTGGDWHLSADNLGRLLELSTPVRVRMPVVPGVNDDPASVRETAARLRELGVAELSLVPFHDLWRVKPGARPFAAGTARPMPELVHDFCDNGLRVLGDAYEL